jgi:multidrug efflux pump subunit AcrA (membrane-fusion protein)
MVANNGKKNKPAPKILSRIKAFFASRKRAAAVAVLVIVIGYFGYQRYTASTKKLTYQTAQAQKSSLVISVSASGQILSTNIINISTSASGVVQDVYVKNGDKVNSGDKIAQITLDAAGQQQFTQASAAYLSAKHNLDAANATLFSLQSTLFSKWKIYTDLATNSTYQDSDGSPNTSNRTLPAFTTVQDDWFSAEANYKNQQGAIAAAQADLSSKWVSYQQASPTITAPISGTVSNLGIVPNMALGSQGSSVSVGTGGSVSSNSNTQTVAVVQNESMPIATFNISETDISSLKIGEETTVTLDATGNKTFTGKVVTVDNIGAVTSGVTNYKVLIAFDTKAPGVLPNMAASAKIITKVKNDVILVPSAAVQTSGGQSTVRIMKNGNSISVPVELGDSNDTQTEIISGVNEGDTVVTSVNSQTTTGSTGATSPFGGGGAGGAFRAIGGGRGN